MLNVYQLQWAGPSIFDDIGDGLMDNNSSIAIHLPFLKKNFEIIKEYKETKLETFSEEFYIKLDSQDFIERMRFNYFDLNDLIFYNKTYNGLKKNTFYTTIELKNNI